MRTSTIARRAGGRRGNRRFMRSRSMPGSSRASLRPTSISMPRSTSRSPRCSPQVPAKLTFDPVSLDIRGDAAGLTDGLQLARGYGLPIYITETGVGDAGDDGTAAAWITETLSRTRDAISAGIPVQGYFFW